MPVTSELTEDSPKYKYAQRTPKHMAPRKGVVITVAILIVITAASFIVWYIPQNSQTAFNVTDFEGHLDATKAIHRTLDASLKEDFEMVVSGSLDTAEYVDMAETATSQSSAQITGLISSSPAEEWVASYAAYVDSLRNFNSYIRETIVYAKLVQEGGSEQELSSIISGAEGYREQMEELVALSDGARP